MDRAYCKLRAVDEVAESVKDIHRNVTHKHAKQAQIMEDMKAQTGNFEKDANERNVRLNQKYRDKEKKFDQAVRKAEKELAEAIEGLKGIVRVLVILDLTFPCTVMKRILVSGVSEQETVYENFANEKATVERSADQGEVDGRQNETCKVAVSCGTRFPYF